MSRMLSLLTLVFACLSAPLVTAAEPSASSDFILRTAPFKASDYVAVRLNPVTGEAWLVKSGNWRAIGENEAPPKGRYDIQLVSSGHPDQTNWNTFRINLDTGKTWRLASGKWQAMQVVVEE